MKNDLTPNFQPPTSYAGFPCSLFREPCSGNWYVDQRRTGWDAMFTFSGKERDQETGYGYFGARYYDSDLSIWLSVDPMAGKYPHQSNYVYCGNNPIRLVDPNGMDEYEFDKKGNLLNVIENKNADILRVVKTDSKGNIKTDKDGNQKVKATSREFEAGSIKSGGNTKLGSDRFDATVLIMSEMGEKNRVDMFEFLAENTNSEWGTYAGVQVWGDYTGVIAASRDEDKDRATSFLVANTLLGKGSVSEWVHSHGLNDGTPSGYDKTSSDYGKGDHGAAIKYGSQIPNMRTYDTRTKLYYQFRAGGYDEGKKR